MEFALVPGTSLNGNGSPSGCARAAGSQRSLHCRSNCMTAIWPEAQSVSPTGMVPMISGHRRHLQKFDLKIRRQIDSCVLAQNSCTTEFFTADALGMPFTSDRKSRMSFPRPRLSGLARNCRAALFKRLTNPARSLPEGSIWSDNNLPEKRMLSHRLKRGCDGVRRPQLAAVHAQRNQGHHPSIARPRRKG